MINKINKSTRLFIAVMFLAGGIYSSVSAEAKKLAIITKIDKKIKIQRVETERWIEAELGDYLYKGDRIKAGSGAYAEITFLNGIEINIEENTEIQIKSKDDADAGKDTDIELYKGKIFNRVRKLSNLKIRTPQAVAAVRGTKFGVELENKTRVYVLEGIVDVYNDKGKVELTEGTETSVEEGQAPSQPEELKEETKENKEEELEKRQLRFSVLGEVIAGRPVEMKISAIDSDGEIDREIDDKILISSPEKILFAKSGRDRLKWKKLPRKIRLESGEKKFFVRSYEDGLKVIAASSNDLSSSALELNFRLPERKNMILDLDNDYKMELEFKRK